MSSQSQTASTNAISSDHRLVDRIVHLGTLGSDRNTIDPMLDTLRVITAGWESSKPLRESERASLNNLESELKKYLIHDDPLRSFTPETLEKRLKSGTGQRYWLDHHLQALITVILLTLGSGVMTLLVPFGQTTSVRQLIAIPVAVFTLHVGIIWFFLTSLRNFNQKFRQAFLYICIGVMLMSAIAASLMLIQVFGLMRYPIFKYAGSVAILSSLAFTFIYAGLRVYAKLLKIKTRATSWSLTIVFVILASGIITLVPHPAKIPMSEELYYLLSLAILAPVAILSIINAVLAGKIMRRVTPAYAKSMKALFIYEASFSLAAPIAIGFVFLVGEFNPASLSGLMATTAIPTQSILLYAGYVFKRETSR